MIQKVLDDCSELPGQDLGEQGAFPGGFRVIVEVGGQVGADARQGDFVGPAAAGQRDAVGDSSFCGVPEARMAWGPGTFC